MKKVHAHLPEIIEKDESQIREIIEAIKACSLSDSFKPFVIKCVELAIWLPLYLQSKEATLHRFRLMIFGKGYNAKNNKENKIKKENQEDIELKKTNPLIPDETLASSANDSGNELGGHHFN